MSSIPSLSKPAASTSASSSPGKPCSSAIQASPVPAPVPSALTAGHAATASRVSPCSSSSSSSTYVHVCSCQQLQQHRHSVRVHAHPVELFSTAGVDPALLQDLIVGGAITSAVGVALYSGLRKDPVPCDLCQGTGGVRCFGCGGDGKMTSLKSRDEIFEQKPPRDILGRSVNPRECRVCKGAGLVLCSKCKGQGYVVVPGVQVSGVAGVAKTAETQDPDGPSGAQ